MPAELKKYAHKVIEEADGVLFEEAIAAARAGALRGSYILIWLSCAESLKRKFRAASSRDATAKKVAGHIERKEQARQAIDMFLLEQAHNYGFINDAQFTKLNHVYELRCIYGHPYEEEPTSEDLLAAAQTVVEAVLSQPVWLRHGYLQEQVRLLTEEGTFLDDTDEAVSEYAKEVAQRTDPTLVLWFMQKLWSVAEAMVGDRTMLVFINRVVWFSATFLDAIEGAIEKQDYRGVITASPVISSYVLADSRAYKKLGPQEQDMVVGNLLDRAKKSSRPLAELARLVESGLLTKRQRERFEQALTETDYNVLRASGVRMAYYVDRLVGDMKSHDWYQQSPAVLAIENAGPEALRDLSQPEQALLGNNVLQCADGSERAARRFLRSLPDSVNQWPRAFVEGVFLECFVNERNQIRFKTDCAADAARCILAIKPAADGRGIIKAVVERIGSGIPKPGHWSERNRKEMLNMLREAQSSAGRCGAPLTPLVGTISEIECEEDD